MVQKTWKPSLQVFRHYIICVAAVKLIQFLTFISDHSVFNNFYSSAFFKSTRESYWFHGNFRKWWKKLENLSYKFFVIISFALLRSSYFIFSHSLQIFLFLKSFTQSPSLNRHEKVTGFMEFSVNGKKNLKTFHTSFSSLYQLHCYGQVTSISYVQFRSFCF